MVQEVGCRSAMNKPSKERSMSACTLCCRKRVNLLLLLSGYLTSTLTSIPPRCRAEWLLDHRELVLV
eukprot:COSAG05_NODE_2591_length_2863_cov_2.560781_3_plen_67_part_00